MQPFGSAAQSTERCNVIFICVDDMNNKLNYLGYPQVLTPNLQRLLNRGMAFTSAYCQFPVCSPSRTSLLSGWRPDKTNVLNNKDDPALFVPEGVNYLQEYLHSFGYRTERYGKIYHDQYEYQFFWDYAEGEEEFLEQNNMFTKGQKNGENKPGLWGINHYQDTSTKDFIYAKKVADRLKEPIMQPLFLSLGLSTHGPFTPVINFWNFYGDSSKPINLPYWQSEQTISGNNAQNIALPNAPTDDWDDIPLIAIALENVVSKPDPDWKKTVQAYYAEVSAMDRNLGLVLDELDSQNLWLNTVVVFTSDHGQNLGEHNGVWLKDNLFEESLKIPLIVCAPGIQPGTCSKLVELVDIYPAITELCRVPTPAGIEGSSFVRLLQNPDQLWKNAAFSQVKPDSAYPLITKCEAVHSGNFHYNYWGPYGEELYNRQADPNEYTNLINDPYYATALDTMRMIRAGGWQNSKPPACDTVNYYKDNDGDGYGNSDSLFRGCYQPIDYVAVKGDCNDNDTLINPGSAELCDGLDNNCNSKIDDNTVTAAITPSGDSITVCDGKSVLLKASRIAGAAYQWLKDGLPVNGAATKNFTVSQAGSYKVIITVNNSCSDTSAAVAVLLVPNPVAKITVLDNLNICAKGFVRLRSANFRGLSYQWRKDNTNISGATGRDYTAVTTGKYTLVVTNANGCADTSTASIVTSSCISTSVVSIDNDISMQNENSKLVVSPNPAKENITIRFNCEKAGIVHIRILSLTGKALIVKKEPAVKGINTYNIYFNNLSAGIYYAEVTDETSTQRVKLIIEK